MPTVPIACSLSADDAVARLHEWQQLLTRDVAEVERTGTTARLRLREDPQAVLAATDLARREKACCAFFEFRLVLVPGAVWLEVDAPADAAPVLDRLLSRPV